MHIIRILYIESASRQRIESRDIFPGHLISRVIADQREVYPIDPLTYQPEYAPRCLQNPVMAVELAVEGKQALEVAALGVERGWRLAGHFRDEVEGGELGETGCGGLDEGWNVMG
jgi:hypothetical protein